MNNSLLTFFKAVLLNQYYQKAKEDNLKTGGKGLANQLFPKKYTNNFELKIKKGKEVYAPIILEASEYDVDPKIRGFAPTFTMKEDKPFFREKMSFNEKDRKNLLEVIQRNDKDEIDLVFGQMLNQIAGNNGFLGAVDALNASMIGQFLTSGVIKINVGGADKILDYKLDDKAKETLTGTTKWDNENSKPLDDLIRWKEKYAEQGVQLNLAILTTKVFNLIKNSTQVKELLEKQKIVFPSQIKQFLEEYTGLEFILWDEKVATKDGKIINVFSDKVVTLVPKKILGHIEYAPTPARTDKMFGLLGKDTQVEDLYDTFASLQVQPVKADGGTVQNIEIVLSSVNAPNPNCLEEMFIATVVD